MHPSTHSLGLRLPFGTVVIAILSPAWIRMAACSTMAKAVLTIASGQEHWLQRAKGAMPALSGGLWPSWGDQAIDGQ